MKRNTVFPVADGLKVSRGSDGHWIQVEHNGKHGAINIEALTTNIIRAAFVNWIDSALELACDECGGHGCVDTPYSGSDPSCASCDGTGIKALEGEDGKV